MSDLAHAFVARLLSAAGLGERPFLLRSSLGGRRGAISVLVFGNGDARPTHFVKAARDARSRFLCKEARLVSRLRDVAPVPDRAFFPGPFEHGRVDGREFLVSPFVDGVPLDPSDVGTRARVRELVAWLARVQAADSRPGRPPVASATMPLANALLPASATQAIRRISATPFVVEHGDFLPANLLATADGYLVTDWEGARRRGLPLVDAVHLALACGFDAREAEELVAPHAPRFGLEPRDVLHAYLWSLDRIHRTLHREWRGSDLEGTFPFATARETVRRRLLA